MIKSDVNKVIIIHDFIIELDRAINPDDYLPGVHDQGVLDSLFEWRIKPNNSIIKNAALILDSITARHAFRNGNKRTGFAVASILLESGGYKINATKEESLEFLLKIASYKMDVESIELWLTENTYHMGLIRFKVHLLIRKTRFGLLLRLLKIFKDSCPAPK